MCKALAMPWEQSAHIERQQHADSYMHLHTRSQPNSVLQVSVNQACRSMHAARPAARQDTSAPGRRAARSWDGCRAPPCARAAACASSAAPSGTLHGAGPAQAVTVLQADRRVSWLARLEVEHALVHATHLLQHTTANHKRGTRHELTYWHHMGKECDKATLNDQHG